MSPKYLSLGLILASLYGLCVSCYMGYLLKGPPAHIRKQLLQNKVEGTDNEYEVHISSEEDLKETLKAISSVFPRIERIGECPIPKTLRLSSTTLEIMGNIRFKLMWQTRILARMHDLDYTAPVWLHIDLSRSNTRM